MTLLRQGILRGVDLNVLARRFWNLEAMRAEGPMPKIRWRAYARGGAWGTAWWRSQRITMRIAVNCSIERAAEALIHELVHCSCPRVEHHGELFCRRLIACCREAFGVELDTVSLLDSPSKVARRAYRIDEIITIRAEALAVGVKLAEDAAYVAPAPVPVTNRAEERKAHAEAMLASWEAKLSRTKTYVSKWRTKVRYYERREAQAAKVKS